jgi:pimeloyl-ACP methyl ester carboxylesterase
MRLDVQGVEVYLADSGSGEPILFLHGVPNTAEMWSDVIAHLCRSYRCLAPDLPGFGRSIAPHNFDCSLKNQADFINELVEAIGIDVPLNLVVHDLGGPYGLAWAVKHPEKIRRIVIMNTLFQSDYSWHTWARIWRTPLVGELSMALLNWPLFRWELRRGSRKLSVEFIRDAYSMISPMMKRMVLRLYRATDPEVFAGWEDELLKLTARVPAIVLWGDHDPYIAKHFAERFGAQTVQHFPTCGHWIADEATDEVLQWLEEFLKT